jgi:methyltransferase (TIGR00027 family)
MFARLPSITAASVALMRGVASLPGAPFDTANDRQLRVLTPRGIDRALSLAGMVTARAPGVHRGLRALSGGLLDHVALRTRAIDVALLAELAAGTRQLVICGAGLDARAFRIPELRDTVVFEVDHPATQPLKRSRVEGHASTAREVRWVTVDFERESLEAKLAEAGHDPKQRTTWIWEGVTPYLLPAATESTLEVIAQRSAKGSLALVTYVLPSMISVRSVALGAGRFGAVHAAFALLGEPLRGAMTSDTLAAMARALDLTNERDTGSEDWGRAHLRGEPFPLRIEERLMALRKT